MKQNVTTIQQKHHYRELLAIGIPVIIGQLGTIVLGFADTLMIGHHSTQELAAAGLVNNIYASYSSRTWASLTDSPLSSADSMAWSEPTR